MDTDMSDGPMTVEGLPTGYSQTSALLNGLRSSEQTPPVVAQSGYASREQSLPVKVANQLNIAESDDETEEDVADDEGFDRLSPQRPALPKSTLPTGLCYDPRMRYHTELDPPKDHSDFHPEDPRRILAIYRTLCEAGLVDDAVLSHRPLVVQPMRMIPARHATRSEVLEVHYEHHFNFLKETATKSEEDLTYLEKKFDSIYFNQSTYNAALLSAGAAVDTCLAVAQHGEVKNAFAVIRPPGHHAEIDRSMGFCHFDNVAIAAKVLRQNVPEVRRILILDWDVHHGNGIQQAFEDDPNVLYISIHVHQDGKFYPSGDYGDHLHCGIGAGIGKNINIPWPTKGMGDSDYLHAFQQIVMPVAFNFDPDFVIIAAGFDAAVGDQLGGCFVTPECYAHMTHMLMSVASGKIVACLEGGYNLKSISKSALSVVKTLMGEPPPRIPARAASKSGIETVHQVLLHQSKYWRCLYPKDLNHEFDDLEHTERMHDVVQTYQSHSLAETFNMYTLPIFREPISRSFDQQVLATEHVTGREDRPLLLIFHDPPEVIGRPDAITGRLDLHTLHMADVLKPYIAWAIEHKMSVIDCNIPKFLTGISDPNGHPDDEIPRISKATEELALYVWENYVEVSDSSKVVLIGVGTAYQAVLKILNTRTWDNVNQFVGAIGFIDHDQLLFPISESFMNDFARHYHKRSQLIVSPAHAVWAPEREGKKASKKFGRLIKARTEGLSRMVQEHRAEMQRFILQRTELAPDSPTTGGGGGGGYDFGGRRVSARTRGGGGGNGDLLGSGLMARGTQEMLIDRLYRETHATPATDEEF